MRNTRDKLSSCPSTEQSTTAGVRSCEFCRKRKVKCDGVKPACGPCEKHERQCHYIAGSTRPRPSRARIHELEETLRKLKEANARQREEMLQSVTLSESLPSDAQPIHRVNLTNDQSPPSRGLPNVRQDEESSESEDGEYDVSTFLSLDDRGRIATYGPSSSLHTGSPGLAAAPKCSVTDADAFQLIAGAALSRQKEHQLKRLPTIGGIASELALHLLDLHWNRAHHTFLLTYRPAIMNSLLDGGPYCSDFLLNAIFAVTSKYSDRLDIRTDPNDITTAGSMFFRRCEELMASQQLLSSSSIPTICGLILLGSTFNSIGHSSRGWLYTGFALRMVYDLGLHLDSREMAGSAEDLEVRRRVFWGAFICDKLQSLYFGRPVTIQLKDARVSRNFLDTYEENELWRPYSDITSGTDNTPSLNCSPVYSVSTFQQFCSLAKIMTRIMNRIYRVGATAASAGPHLMTIDQNLERWYNNVPPHLLYKPWKDGANSPLSKAAPNIITLFTTYNACVILLHRPFISCGHLKSTSIPSNSWKRCNTAARNITSLATAYRASYSLRRGSYLLAYAVYVACTIHTRSPNVASSTGGQESSWVLSNSLNCLDELVVANPGVASQANVIRKLMETNNIIPRPLMIPDATSHGSSATASDQALNEIMQGWSTAQDFALTPSASRDLQDLVDFPTFEMNGQGMDVLFGFMDYTSSQLPGF